MAEGGLDSAAAAGFFYMDECFLRLERRNEEESGLVPKPEKASFSLALNTNCEYPRKGAKVGRYSI